MGSYVSEADPPSSKNVSQPAARCAKGLTPLGEADSELPCSDFAPAEGGFFCTCLVA